MIVRCNFKNTGFGGKTSTRLISHDRLVIIERLSHPSDSVQLLVLIRLSHKKVNFFCHLKRNSVSNLREIRVNVIVHISEYYHSS